MNIQVKKNLVPRIITNCGCGGIYIGFVHETSKRPLIYYDFLICGAHIEDIAPYEKGDNIQKLSLTTYFRLNEKLMRKNTKYNLLKKIHDYNKKKYKPISTKSNRI